MKSICLYFKIHQPFRLKRYRFFDIGNDHWYFDDFANDEIVTRIAEQSYIPTCRTLLEMIKENGKDFHCAIDISGIAVEQFDQYVPELTDLLKELAETGCVEFLSGTYGHDLSSLEDPEEFLRSVHEHDLMIHRTFGVKPKVIANTELIYDDDIALLINSMGFHGALTEGAKHILGWKSPNYVYNAASCPDLKLLLTNDKLTEDITMRFSNHDWHEYPLTADKYLNWIAELPEDQQVVNLYLPMETFGAFHPANTGIFDFLRALPRLAKERNLKFSKPSEVLAKLKPVDQLAIPYPISGSDEARDISAWTGNDLQREALRKLYAVAERVSLCDDRRLKQDWKYLQSSDHFFYMSTKNMADGASHASFSPYDSPFSAFTNYMNVLADFIVRVEEQYPLTIENEELNSLLLTIRNQASEIESLGKELKTLRAHSNEDEELPVVEVKEEVVEAPKAEKKAAAKKPAAKKPAAKKAAKK